MDAEAVMSELFDVFFEPANLTENSVPDKSVRDGMSGIHRLA
jgi:hypothetical protein